MKQNLRLYVILILMCITLLVTLSSLNAQQSGGENPPGHWGRVLSWASGEPKIEYDKVDTLYTYPSNPKYFGGGGGNAAWGKAALIYSSITNWKSAQSWTALNKDTGVDWEICSAVGTFTINGLFIGSTSSYCEKRKTKNSELKSQYDDNRGCTSGLTYTWNTSSRHRADNLKGIDKSETNQQSINVLCGG